MARTRRAVVTICPVWREACSAAWKMSPNTVDGNCARPRLGITERVSGVAAS
jgi:hypothetical protein